MTLVKRIAPLAVFAAFVVACLVGASAQSAPAPILLGSVTGDAEKDTWACPMAATPVRQIVLTGPARYVGAVTGNPEKDTFALVEAAGFAPTFIRASIAGVGAAEPAWANVGGSVSPGNTMVRSARFVFPNVPAGTHTVRIEWSMLTSGTVRAEHRTLTVQHR